MTPEQVGERLALRTLGWRYTDEWRLLAGAVADAVREAVAAERLLCANEVELMARRWPDDPHARALLLSAAGQLREGTDG